MWTGLGRDGAGWDGDGECANGGVILYKGRLAKERRGRAPRVSPKAGTEERTCCCFSQHSQPHLRLMVLRPSVSGMVISGRVTWSGRPRTKS